MNQATGASLDLPLSSQPFPGYVSAEAQKLSPPAIETGESSFSLGQEQERVAEPLRFVYNEERLEFLLSLERSIEEASRNIDSWREYLEELELWDNTVADGLTEDEPPD